MLTLGAASTAVRADQPTDLQAFRSCAAIKADSDRLACYDKAAAAFDFDGTKKRLNEATKLKAEADRLRAEAEARKAETTRLKAEAQARKAEADRLKAEADARKAEADRAEAAEKARMAALERQKAEQAKSQVEDFGKPAKEDKALAHIESTISHLTKPRPGSAHGVTIQLENGQTWYQTDNKRTGTIRAGMAVRIVKGPFGGFMLTIKKTNRSFYVKRIG
ncbi:hypothetical protein K6118_15200 [Kordiimonas sp. A6E486]|nr:hypothetical protein [Kordiimonas marina]